VHMARWVILGTFEIVVGVPNGGGQKYPHGNEYKRDLRTVVLVLAGMLVSAPLQDGHSYDCRKLGRKMNSNRLAFSSLP
jgi:hypothetical protein